MQRRVLVVANGFTPGFGGGSIRTIDHLCRHLGDDVEFFVLTRNHDYGDPTPYDLDVGVWMKGDDTNVRYERPWRRTPRLVAKVADDIDADIVIVNSMFASGAISALTARWLRLLNRPTIIAPEGELGASARGQGRTRLKTVFLSMTRRLGFHRNVTWRAASTAEAEDIERFAGGGATVVTAPSLPPPITADTDPPMPARADARDRSRLVYLSAIDGRKGAVRAAQFALQSRTGTLDLYGFVRDETEFATLLELIESDGAGRIRYCGTVDHAATADVLAAHDALIFPTEEEVLGYVVGEALLAGCPVLVSDRTPWQDLDACGAGRVLPLHDDDAWVAAIDELASASADRLAARRRAALERGRRWADADDDIAAWRDLFDAAAR